MSGSDTLRAWIVTEVRAALQGAAQDALVVWCDPRGEWLDVLRAASDNAFELWADPLESELALRYRFAKTPRSPRVTWLPCAREKVSWFKVFELEAAHVWERGLLSALRDYGVEIPRDMESEISPLLPTYAREWLDKPLATWAGLTPGHARGALVDDHRMLEAIAGPPGEFQLLHEEERFELFAGRATKDFGLPDPHTLDERPWRVASLACLLCTEAAAENPQEPPRDPEHVIPAGPARDNALRLLRDCQENVRFIPVFEDMVREADSRLTLGAWAGSLSAVPRSHASRIVEQAVYDRHVRYLDRTADISALCCEMDRRANEFRERTPSFWGTTASCRVPWAFLTRLADSGALLVQSEHVEEAWTSARDAIDWYGTHGWLLDLHGDGLLGEDAELPPELEEIRGRLRAGYLRAIDRIGQAFSQLVAQDPDVFSEQQTVGEVGRAELDRESVPTALLIVDALRLDVGHTLADMLNKGEPEVRARVLTAAALAPTITPLGMAFGLPMSRDRLKVDWRQGWKSPRVVAEGFSGDLAIAEQRRGWLKANLGVHEVLSVADVIDGYKARKAPRAGKIVVVEGSELDTQGHEGLLKLSGAGEHVGRYAQAIWRLRDWGYQRVVVLTDHGFFHWQPDPDEMAAPVPSGDVVWTSRRAVVGHGLSHANALVLTVPGSDLQVAVPRGVGAFRTYGGIGFFHGGCSLQEAIVPVVIVRWPPKARKTAVVLKPVEDVSTLSPRVVLEAGVSGLFGADERVLARRALVVVSVSTDGRIAFEGEAAVTVEPDGKPVTVALKMVNPCPAVPYGTLLTVRVLDADDRDVLVTQEVALKVDIDEW